MIFVCSGLVIIPALKLPYIFSIFMWTFSFAIPIFGVYLIGMMWKINKVAAWVTVLAGYAANFLWTFAPPTWLPSYMSLNVYPTTFATVLFGVVLNLILPGEPGYLHQIKMAKKQATLNTLAS